MEGRLNTTVKMIIERGKMRKITKEKPVDKEKWKKGERGGGGKT